MMSEEIEFLERCKRLGLHDGPISVWVDRIERLEHELAECQRERGELVAALAECRSSVKFDLIHYEKMARAYGNIGREGEQTHLMAEAEANRLHKLIDTIDALAKVGAGETGETT